MVGGASGPAAATKGMLMSDRFSSVNRREWFSSCLAATVLGSTLNDRLLAGPEDRLVPVAGVATVYTRNSHCLLYTSDAADE